MTTRWRRMRQRSGDAGIYLIAAAALAVALSAIWRRTGASADVSVSPTRVAVARTIAEPNTVLAHAHRLGTTAARLRIVVFSDFQCRHCAAAAKTLDESVLRTRHDVGVAFVHMPLSAFHSRTYMAAVVAECAALQGRFRAVHDLLFVRQSELASVSDWSALVHSAGVSDTAAMRECLADESPQSARARVARASEAASRIGVNGTPMFLIDSILHPAGTPLHRLLQGL